jgi:hypothetical protein
VRITVSNRDLPPLQASLQCGHGAVSSWSRSRSDLSSLQPAARCSSGQRNRIASKRRQPRRGASCSDRSVGCAAGCSRAPLHPDLPLLQPLSRRGSPIRRMGCQIDALAHTEQRLSLSGKRCSYPVRAGSVRAARFRRRGQIAWRSAPRLVVPAANAVRAAVPRSLPITAISLLVST